MASNAASHHDQAQRDVVDMETDRDADVRETSSPLATRQFVVRFNYDPFTMSPNADPESELSLTAGERVMVTGNVDSVRMVTLLYLRIRKKRTRNGTHLTAVTKV